MLSLTRSSWADSGAEEFNKYLSYVRNLGFEDTPDYDHLRELFTQALKNTGEVEDGEYDWMKLNNGKGWEAMKQHPSQIHLHQANAVPNSSQREIHHGNTRGQQTPAQLTAARLNAAQPPPPSPAKPGLGKTRERQSASGAVPTKRQSGAAGGLTEVATPAASTLAQFQHSSSHLPPRISAQPNVGQNAMPSMMTTAGPANVPRANQAPPPPPRLTAFQKLMKILCCGSTRAS
jgi:casein kinase 1